MRITHPKIIGYLAREHNLSFEDVKDMRELRFVLGQPEAKEEFERGWGEWNEVLYQQWLHRQREKLLEALSRPGN